MKYTVEWSEEDECFIAKCLEFPSLSTHGPTKAKAAKDLDTVIEESLKWIEEEGPK